MKSNKIIKLFYILFVIVLLSSCSHTHTYGEWKITKEARCITSGERTRKCECGDIEVEVINALGHTEVIDEAKSATCTTDGLTEGKHCSVCDEVLVAQEVITAGHTIVLDEAKLVTCEKDGLTQGKHCSTCGEIFVAQEVIKATGHNYIAKVTLPTCEGKGYTTYTCSSCDDSYVDSYVSALGHTEVVDAAVPATCTSEGLTEGKHCSVCDKVLITQEVVKKLSHTIVIDAGVQSTCTTDGITDGEHCSVCDTVLIPQEVIPAGHTIVIDEGEKATCTTDGLTEGKHCSACNEVLVKQNVIEAIGHNYIANITSPTCEEDGYTTHTCSNCNDSFIDTYVDSLGHNTIVVQKGTSPTCTEVGYTDSLKCTVCNTIVQYQTELPMIDHVLSNKECVNCNYIDYLSYTLNPDGLSYSVKKGTAFDEIDGLTMPSTYRGKPVTKIEDYGFAGSSRMWDLKLPDSITIIGDFAFYGCTDLEYLRIYSKVTEIGSNAFLNCTSLKTVYYIGGVEDWCKIEFENYTSTPLFHAENIYFTDENSKSYKPTTLTIPNTITEIKDYSFYRFTSLNTITIPSSVKRLGDYAFYNCNALTNVTLINGLETISKYCFYNCDSLTNISIPDTVTSIKNAAFDDCSALSMLTLGSGMTSIGDDAFNNTVIQNIYYNGTIENWCNIIFENEKSNPGDFYIKNGNGSYEEVTEIIVPNTITKIGDYQFVGFDQIKKVTLPNTITSIGERAFRGCIELEEINIPDSVKSIGNDAFAWNKSLTSVILPEGLETLGDMVFASSTLIDTLVIPSTVISIGENVLYQVIRLKNIYFTGTKEQWDAIEINSNNEVLNSKTIIYNFVKE